LHKQFLSTKWSVCSTWKDRLTSTKEIHPQSKILFSTFWVKLLWLLSKPKSTTWLFVREMLSKLVIDLDLLRNTRVAKYVINLTLENGFFRLVVRIWHDCSNFTKICWIYISCLILSFRCCWYYYCIKIFLKAHFFLLLENRNWPKSITLSVFC